MNRYTDPFIPIFNELSELKKIVLEIKNAPKEDFSLKYYTREECANFLSCSKQTIDNYDKNGWIKIEDFGPRKKLIQHYQIFNQDNSLKNFKYKRKA
jgi:hypothetical protein